MEDKELYRHVLGLEEPWRVDKVQLDMRKETVDVWAVHKEGISWPCPECGTLLPVYDHAPERVWRNLDTCQDISSCSDSPGGVSESRGEAGESGLGGSTFAVYGAF